MRANGLSWIAGSVCLGVTGCFSYAPYGHPTSFGPPPNTAMVPQPVGPGTASAGSAWVPAGPVLATPPGTANVTSPRASAPTPAKKAASGTRDMFEEPEAGKSVPEPRDPANARPQETTQPFGRNDGALLERRGVKTSQTSVRPRDDDDRSLNERGNELPELADSDTAFAADEDSLPANSIVRSAQFSTEVKATAVTPASAQRETFGYDTENYAWLNGIAEFSPSDQSWHLTYSQAPHDADVYGGEVTLKRNPVLSVLRQRGAIQVEGRFDPNQRDRLGKPVYEVVRLISPSTRSR
jgi:hypothetical protein